MLRTLELGVSISMGVVLDVVRVKDHQQAHFYPQCSMCIPEQLKFSIKIYCIVLEDAATRTQNKML